MPSSSTSVDSSTPDTTYVDVANACASDATSTASTSSTPKSVLSSTEDDATNEGRDDAATIGGENMLDAIKKMIAENAETDRAEMAEISAVVQHELQLVKVGANRNAHYLTLSNVPATDHLAPCC